MPSPSPTSTRTPDSITRVALQQLSATYSEVAAAQPAQPRAPRPRWPLAELDEFRFTELPTQIRERRGKVAPGGKDKAAGGWIELEELEKLMGWKLYRGVYRPALPGLISSNSPQSVITTTATAFAQLDSIYATSKPASAESAPPAPALKALCALRGVGPATASLVAAVAQPAAVPFFSDELYAWAADGERGGKGRYSGLKYNDKEYRQLWECVAEVRERLGKDEVTAADVERAAYVVRRPVEESEEPKTGKRKSVVADSESKSTKKTRKG